jgi:non-ribosomal peptide synthetase-like protein
MGKSHDVLTTDPADDLTALAECERRFAEILADILDTQHVSVDSHFFDDLGGDSMLMARFCARVRKQADLPPVSMPDVYQHPTIRSLAASLATTTTTTRTTPTPASQPATPAALPEPPRRAGRGEYVLCGVLQLLFILGYPALTVMVSVKGYEWVATSPGAIDFYLRSIAFGGAVFLGLSTLPILLKWVLIGRWKPQQIPVWTMAYFRFWLVKTLVQLNPMALFVGSPLYALYLKALGAKVGRGAVILTKPPVCTDLLTIGDGAVIRKDSLITGYRAHDGVIQTGAVSIGKDALVGEATVLDIWTCLGDGAQLAHSSSLHAGQTVPDGERWHGSPAQPSGADCQRIPPRDVGARRRRVFFGIEQLVNLFLLGGPLMFGIVVLALTKVPQLTTLLAPGPVSFTTWDFYRDDALIFSTVLFFGATLVGLVSVRIVPRVLNLFITPDKVYPLYGFHYWVLRAITRATNVKFYMTLFGGSSYIIHYLRWLGYDLRGVRQTGSNFGEMVKHDTPFLTSVGSGTMVADGLSIINADFSNSSFRLSRVSIGAENFLGNMISYPAQGKTGDNCLLASKLMVPLDGEVREGVGLLGSPSFEIPRSVARDRQLDVNAEELRRGLRAKNVYNTISMALFLLMRWTSFFVLTVLYLAAVDLWASLGAPAVALATVGAFVFTVAYNLVIERLIRPLMALRPQGCSIYDRAFWRHERFWKLSTTTYLTAFNGTPMKNVLWRLVGMRIGRQVFDDGLHASERAFVTIGDYCTLNANTTAQSHSQEDGGFKSDHIVIGAGCTLGVGAWVHYGATMGDGAVLTTDSFLMKGEEMPPNAVWGGNPARKLRELSGDLQVPKTSIDGNGAAVLVRGD